VTVIAVCRAELDSVADAGSGQAVGSGANNNAAITILRFRKNGFMTLANQQPSNLVAAGGGGKNSFHPNE
jgi:hypothetical protein